MQKLHPREYDGMDLNQSECDSALHTAQQKKECPYLGEFVDRLRCNGYIVRLDHDKFFSSISKETISKVLINKGMDKETVDFVINGVKKSGAKKLPKKVSRRKRK